MLLFTLQDMTNDVKDERENEKRAHTYGQRIRRAQQRTPMHILVCVIVCVCVYECTCMYVCVRVLILTTWTTYSRVQDLGCVHEPHRSFPEIILKVKLGKWYSRNACRNVL